MKLLVLLLTLTVVAARSSHGASSAKDTEKESKIVQNLQKLKEMLLDKVDKARSGAVAEAAKEEPRDDRKGKSLGYFSYFPPTAMMHLNFPGFFPQSKAPIIPEEWLSRTEPFKRKTSHLVDSPTYYIRLPPNPYVFVPGVGYVSRPPTMTDPEVLNGIPSSSADKPEPFYHLPLNFMANGKPTTVFQLPNEHVRPKPESSILTLNKGPYLFNGKPSEIYLLRNSFNALYADALTNFYP